MAAENRLLMLDSEPVSVFHGSDQHGNMAMTVNAIPMGLGKQQGRANPAQTMVPTLPAFHLETNATNGGEAGFDAIGAGQGLSECVSDSEVEHGKSIVQALRQATGRAGVHADQLIMQFEKRIFGIGGLVH